MTEPISVGSVSVEVVASTRAFAASLKKEVESAFKGLDLEAAIRSSLGSTKVKLPVEPDFDTDGLGEKVRTTRVPKVPVELDPVLGAFQAEVRRQTDALARTVNAKVPVGADTTGLRAELGAEIAAVQRELKATIPTEPGGEAEYALKLRAAVDAATAKVKAKVKLEPDDAGGSFGGALKGLLGGIGGGLSLPTFSGISSGISSLVSSIQQAAASSAQLGGSLAGSLQAAAGPIGLVTGLLATAAAAMLGLAAAATFAVPAMSAVAGAAAAIPAALAGVGAVVGTFALGFKGITDAFKPKTGGGGGGGGQNAAQQARQIAAAERGVEAARRGIAAATRGVEAAERGYTDAQQGVTDAQQRAKLAQDAVNKARKEAAEDLDDLGRALRGAQLDEEDATLGVQDALRALNDAKLTGNLPDIERADLAYQRAQLTLENAKDSAQDLGDQQADASKKGVEGSDKVQSALRDQADALEAVKKAQEGALNAQDAILSAQDGQKSAADGLKSAEDSLASAQQKQGAAAAAAAAKQIKLAASAQAFVDAIKKLKPAFDSLRLDVQQKLFEGLDKTVAEVGKTWIPALKVTLGDYATTFNGFFKSLGTSITTPKFISDIQAGAEGARQGIAKIGTSITSALVPAFGTLSAAAGPFLSELGGEIADIVTEFSKWVLAGQNSGALKDFFATSTRSVHDLFATGKLTVKIIGDLFGILTGTSLANGKTTPLESFNNQLAKLHDFLSSPEGKKAVSDFVENLKAKFETIGGAFEKISNAIDKVNGFLDSDSGTKVNTLGETIGRNLFSGLVAGFGAAIVANFVSLATLAQAVVDKFKELFGIHSPSTVFAEIGHDLVAGLLQGITGGFNALVEKAGELKTVVVGALASAGSWLVATGKNAVAGLANGIVSFYGTLSTRAVGLRTTVINALSTAASWLVNTGKNAVIGLANGIVSLYGTVSTKAAGLRTTITNALSNAASLLVTDGKNVVIGLWNGITSLGGWLYTHVVDFVASNVKNAFKSALQIGSPSRMTMGIGRFVTQGLAIGMRSEVKSVEDAAAAISEAATPSFGDPSVAFGLDDAAISRSLQASSQQQVVLTIDPTRTGDWLMDGLRKNIKFSHRGSVNAALDSP